MRTVPRMLRGLWVAVSLLCLIGSTRAEQPIIRDLPPGLQIPAAALTGPSFDVDNATEAYLALLSPEQHKRSDEYFEGGYWLKLWEVLWTVSACLLLLLTGVSNRISQWSQRLSRRSWISTPIFIALFLVALFLLDLPLTVYTDFLRERQYGLSEQPFGAWIRDQMIVLAANVVIFAVALSVTYAAVRRTGARWWIWATGLTWVTLMTVQLLLPAYILPLLNAYKPLPDGPVKAAVLPLARANQLSRSPVVNARRPPGGSEFAIF